jgi:hypothetical protein
MPSPKIPDSPTNRHRIPDTPASPATVAHQSRSITLESEWTFYFELGQPKGMTKEAYEINMKNLGSFTTVQVDGTNRIHTPLVGRILLDAMLTGFLAILEQPARSDEASRALKP